MLGSSRPTVNFFLKFDSAFAAEFGLYPTLSAMARIRFSTSERTPPRPCKARSTVPRDTFAYSAISLIVADIVLFVFLSLGWSKRAVLEHVCVCIMRKFFSFVKHMLPLLPPKMQKYSSK